MLGSLKSWTNQTHIILLTQGSEREVSPKSSFIQHLNTNSHTHTHTQTHTYTRQPLAVSVIAFNHFNGHFGLRYAPCASVCLYVCEWDPHDPNQTKSHPPTRTHTHIQWRIQGQTSRHTFIASKHRSRAEEWKIYGGCWNLMKLQNENVTNSTPEWKGCHSHTHKMAAKDKQQLLLGYHTHTHTQTLEHLSHGDTKSVHFMLKLKCINMKIDYIIYYVSQRKLL